MLHFVESSVPVDDIPGKIKPNTMHFHSYFYLSVRLALEDKIELSTTVCFSLLTLQQTGEVSSSSCAQQSIDHFNGLTM